MLMNPYRIDFDSMVHSVLDPDARVKRVQQPLARAGFVVSTVKYDLDDTVFYSGILYDMADANTTF